MNELKLKGCMGALTKAMTELRETRDRLKIMRKALKDHECPGDGSTDQECYVRIIIEGKKCTATEALSNASEVKP